MTAHHSHSCPSVATRALDCRRLVAALVALLALVLALVNAGCALFPGDPFSAARGGATLGITFVSREGDPFAGAVIDPRSPYPVQHARLMDHEGNHVRQWLVLGPAMPVVYGLNEAVVAFIPHDPGCLNVMEWSAGYPGGGYKC